MVIVFRLVIYYWAVQLVQGPEAVAAAVEKDKAQLDYEHQVLG